MAERARRSIRAPEFDYSSPGAYFVTICTQGRVSCLSQIVEQNIILSPEGRIVTETWNHLPDHYPYLLLDEFVVMPNHLYGILIITEDPVNPPHGVGARLRPAPTEHALKRHPLSEIVRALKSFSTREINRLRNTPGEPVWQRNYYEHILQDDESLQKVRLYVLGNPASWQFDPYAIERP